jgi:hypothetical protein
MDKSAEELRDDIARTRENLSGTLDAIEDRVVPARMVGRRKERFRSRLSSIKETVMGSTDDLSHRTSEAGGQLSEHLSGANEWAHQVCQTARRGAEGNPLGAGLIAFGAGFLAAAIFPGTQTEGQAAQKVQEAAQPLAGEARQVGKELVSDLQPAAQEAAQQVKETAVAGVNQVKDTAGQATEEMKSAATQAAGEVGDQAQKSSEVVRNQS